MAVRLLALALWLLLCLLGYGVWPSARRRARWAQRFLGQAAGIVGVKVRTIGAPAAAPLLLLANHVSWIDIFALAGETGTAFVAHDGLASHPLLRWLCRLNRTVFIARHKRGSVGEQTGQLRRALEEDGAVTLFPEGTTGDGTALLPFKSSLLGAIEDAAHHLSAQPVLLDYGSEAASVAWFGDEHGVTNFLRMLARARPIALTVQFLAPLEPAERASRKTMASAAREHILAAKAAAQRVAL